MAGLREIRFFQSIDRNYYQLFCREIAPENPKATVLLLHDYAGNGLDFRIVTKRLVTHGYRVLVPDLPGRGSSAALPKDAYTLVNLAKSLDACLEDQDDEAVSVVAVGWSGTIALLAAALNPKRYQKLICLDTHPVWEPSDPTPYAAMQKISSQVYSSQEELLTALRPVARVLPGMGTSHSPRLSRIGEQDAGFRYLAHPSIFEFAVEHVEQKIDFSRLCLSIKVPTFLWFSGEIPRRTLELAAMLKAQGQTLTPVDHAAFSDEIPLTSERQLLMLLGVLACGPMLT